jgi:sterol desaturase/sphingolipid hydroxylase (fatty acid hydroxylase superfamily)
MPWSIISVGACFMVFGLLSLRFPCNPGQPKFVTRESPDDLLYYFVSVLFYTGLSLVIARWLAAAFAGGPDAAKAMERGYGWLPRLPLIVQIAIIFVVTDILQYWLHRAFHSRELWPFHAVHHSARHVDWSTTFRVHPVNYLAHTTSVAVLTQLMGFSPLVFVVIAPINLAIGAMVHANLDWTFGPFRYVIASPVFHRWHHSRDPEVRDKNFAPTFPVLDLMFGTFHMPKGRLPDDYGVDGAPEHFLGQMAYPFRLWLDQREKARRPGLSPG